MQSHMNRIYGNTPEEKKSLRSSKQISTKLPIGNIEATLIKECVKMLSGGLHL